MRAVGEGVTAMAGSKEADQATADAEQAAVAAMTPLVAELTAEALAEVERVAALARSELSNYLRVHFGHHPAVAKAVAVGEIEAAHGIAQAIVAAAQTSTTMAAPAVSSVDGGLK